MIRRVDEHRRELIDKITAHAEKKLAAKQAKLFVAFVRQYLANVPMEDLESRNAADLYGAALSHWNFIYERKPGQTKLRVYNPHLPEDGWESTHTVIEVSTDDMPFLIDSMQIEINREGLGIYLIIHMGGMKLRRDDQGRVIEVLPYDAPMGDSTPEAPIHIEIDRQTDPKILQELQKNLLRVFADVKMSVADWPKMFEKLKEALADLEKNPPPLDAYEINESKAYLQWLMDNHFIFLGYHEYAIQGKNKDLALVRVENTGLGLLRDKKGEEKPPRLFSSMPAEAKTLALSPQILVIAETNTKSTIHRKAYMSYVGIKRFDAKKNVIGERRFIGLYTSVAYTSSATQIPFLRHKVETVIKRSQLPVNGHAGKALLNILEMLPRDDLFQASVDELFEISMGILQLQERKKIRLFVRKDIYSRYVSCLVYLPRDRVDTQLRIAIQDILMTAFNGVECVFATQFFDSMLARIHYVIRVDTTKPLDYDLKAIEAQIIEAGRSWTEELIDRLHEYFGEERGNQLALKYHKAFPAGYRDDFDPRTAVYDMEQMERLSPDHQLEMNFYRPLDEAPGVLRFKLFQPENPIPLSDVLPILENMGLRVLGERPHQIVLKDGKVIWINDFGTVHAQGAELDVTVVRDIFQEAFQKIWYGDVENDGFNRLGLSAGLTWREISVFRSYTKYLRQLGFTFSQAYIEETMANNPVLAKYLMDLFKLRFEPSNNNHSKNNQQINELETKIYAGLDAVMNLDEDRILRRILELIKATTRTNYYQKASANHGFKIYISFKFDPTLISDIPLPRPRYEIFVYSPRFEGVHLRTSKVARGGIRWSDRREDFRTEVLGLMKAQQVKNAVIVPSGGKGGFVTKSLPSGGTRDAIMTEVIACYKDFIRGLLDLTDNRKNGQIIYPLQTVRYDDDDSYFVVAADKGTATFSDIANAISKEYGFWMGDAFASGGSAGYDHKKIGITARGAWESVKRHLRQVGINPNETDFTVVGIGDMSGDVFGNGMLMSDHIKLIGAFNHEHVFIDPNPDAEKSFEERKRLFNLPRSAWSDYDPKLISKGGGVYKRSAKSIALSPEIKKVLNLEVDAIEPNELIRALLKAPVDLLWNGGIGTFVKATTERHADVGDRTNDAIRINGVELTCRVAGEGGNLGFTQLGRVEYSLNNGLVYTDFIDNSGGVDCSDHEVNIKILLNPLVDAGDMTLKQRNTLLTDMTDEVASLVISQNYFQTQALDIAASQAASNIDLYSRYMDEQEKQDKLQRSLEFLPDAKALSERKAMGQGLTRPELAVLLAYCKNSIKNELLSSKLPEELYIAQMIEMEFPKALRKRFSAQLDKHNLRREIVTTQLTNFMINNMGITFVHRLHDETGAPLSSIVRAFVAAQKIFEMRNILSAIEALDTKVSAEVQTHMTTRVMRLIRRATRWFLRNRRTKFDIEQTVEHFSSRVKQLYEHLPELLTGSSLAKFEALKEKFLSAGVPQDLTRQVAISGAMFSVLDVIETATENNLSIDEVATIYFSLDEYLGLGWFRDQISSHPVKTHWDALARAALRDDIDWQQRGLTLGIIRLSPDVSDPQMRINAWIEKHKILVRRWDSMLAELRSVAILEFIMFSVAVRELLDLTQASIQSVKYTKNKKK